MDFIQPQAGGRDVFVHMSAVERAGLSTLNEGQHVEYEIEENRGKTSAVKSQGQVTYPRVSGDRCGDAVGGADKPKERE
jgi:cold shock CspA family protein